MCFHQNIYGQFKFELFKDYNKSHKYSEVSDLFKTGNNSFIATLTTEKFNSYVQSISYHDILKIKDSTASIIKINSTARPSIIGGNNTIFFEHDYRLKSARNDSIFAFTNAQISYNKSNTLIFGDKIVFERYNPALNKFELVVSEHGGSNELIIPSINFNDNTSTMHKIDSTNFLIVAPDEITDSTKFLKINIETGFSNFLNKIPGRNYRLFSTTESYLIFAKGSSIFYQYNINTDTVELINLPKYFWERHKISARNTILYSHQNFDYTIRGVGIHNFETRESLENNNFSLASFIGSSGNHVYFNGSENQTNKYFIFHSDTLLQNVSKVEISLNPKSTNVLQKFVFKDCLYLIHEYKANYHIYWPGQYIEVIKYNPITETSEIIFNSEERGLNRNYFDLVTIEDLIICENKFYFNTNRSGRAWHNQQKEGHLLWESNGTKSGTKIFYSATNYNHGSDIKSLSKIGNNIFFWAQKDNGLELLRTDCSPFNIMPAIDTVFTHVNFEPDNFDILELNNKLIFQASQSSYPGRVFSSTGKKEETKKIIDFSLGEKYFINDSLIYFSGDPRTIYKTNGDSYSIVLTEDFIADYTIVGDKIYYFAGTQYNQLSLFEYNLTNKQKILIHEFPNLGYNYPKFHKVVNNKLVFIIRDFQSLYQAHSLDLQTKNIEFLIALNEELSVKMVLLKNKIYFFTLRHIFETDGFAINTKVILNRGSGAHFLNPSFESNDNFAFFLEHFENDGVRTSIPVLFDGIHFQYFYNYPQQGWDVDLSEDAVYFRFNDSTFVSFGTEESTFYLCKERIQELVQVNNYTFFTITTDEIGKELYVMKRCKNNEILTSNQDNNQIFSTNSYIKSTQIVKSTHLIYRAGNSIELNPGFTTSPQTLFKAEIERCED
ncbi:MAG: hypothetical protein Q8K92_21595 [Leadbetterella sp.]|nr:hypothetical protein [Leadbetterella sp.]